MNSRFSLFHPLSVLKNDRGSSCGDCPSSSSSNGRRNNCRNRIGRLLSLFPLSAGFLFSACIPASLLHGRPRGVWALAEAFRGHELLSPQKDIASLNRDGLICSISYTCIRVCVCVHRNYTVYMMYVQHVRLHTYVCRYTLEIRRIFSCTNADINLHGVYTDTDM